MYLPIFKPTKAYVVAVGATASQQGAAVTLGIGTLRLVSTTNCWFNVCQFASPTQPTKSNSSYLPAGVVEYVHVSPNGNEGVCVLEDSATGSLSVTEMTR